MGGACRRARRNHPAASGVVAPMGVFRDPLVLLVIAAAAAMAFFLVATTV
jgi:hypothetical protein